MFRLVLKDFKITKGFYVVMILLSIILGIVNGLVGSFEILPLNLAYIFFVSYILPTISENIDEKYNSNQFLVSLPIKRSKVVIAKYMAGIILPVLIYCILFFTNSIVNLIIPSNGTVISLYVLIGVLIVNLLQFSLYYPIGFKYSHQKANIVRSMFLFSIILLPSALAKIFNIHRDNVEKFIMYFINNLNFNLIIILAISLMIFIISMVLSISIYEKKEI